MHEVFYFCYCFYFYIRYFGKLSNHFAVINTINDHNPKRICPA